MGKNLIKTLKKKIIKLNVWSQIISVKLDNNIEKKVACFG